MFEKKKYQKKYHVRRSVRLKNWNTLLKRRSKEKKKHEKIIRKKKKTDHSKITLITRSVSCVHARRPFSLYCCRLQTPSRLVVATVPREWNRSSSLSSLLRRRHQTCDHHANFFRHNYPCNGEFWNMHILFFSKWSKILFKWKFMKTLLNEKKKIWIQGIDEIHEVAYQNSSQLPLV